MHVLSKSELAVISAGQCEASCQDATLYWLNQCDYEQLKQINIIFQQIVTHPDMYQADGETIKAAMIEAIAQATF